MDKREILDLIANMQNALGNLEQAVRSGEYDGTGEMAEVVCDGAEKIEAEFMG
jgi:hypothetical protein